MPESLCLPCEMRDALPLVRSLGSSLGGYVGVHKAVDKRA